ncbi:hypothetical protein T03_11827 [Trichinella britovi]|uniref:DUF5641 domain-containing protein n=1 Tax=Trichinella britovi TaxID=45882 RepID=A0A0V1DAL0_TRIBR|nr:hypothetical protein T09_9424 [Trichinella sp. T9]KRY58479.1 hypothetical protein T03_11827 [Trichinella britovi]
MATRRQEPRIGHIILVSESSVPRKYRRLTIIVQLYPGREVVPKALKMQPKEIAGGTLKRLPTKLYLMDPAEA